nr:hypothetical protein [Tanacetum cinerariifolium]
TIFYAPPGYVGLYTHSFSLANLRLPLTKFFCEVLEYFHVHISMFNPFGCAKLTTFVVMCRAYGYEPSVDLFRGFFNLCRAGKWLTFTKRNFIYIEVDEDLLFLPKEAYPGFKIGSTSVLVNTEPLKADEELVIQPAEVTTDFKESMKPKLFVVYPGSVAARIKDMKCKTRGGSSRPLDDVPYLTVFDDDEGLPDVLEIKDAIVCHFKISGITSPAWKNHLDNHIDVELLDLHDRCYARQAAVDNAVNKREEECEELRARCETDMTLSKKNPTKWAGYQQSLSTLESKVTSLKAKKARLKAVEVSIQKKVDELKQDRREEPLDLSNVKGYRSSYKKDHTQANNNLAIATFPWLDEFVADPSAPIKALLSKKPPSL